MRWCRCCAGWRAIWWRTDIERGASSSPATPRTRTRRPAASASTPAWATPPISAGSSPALIEGWGGRGLLECLRSERRPVAERIVKQAAGNFMRDRRRPSHPKIAEDSPEARRPRGAKWAQAIVARRRRSISPTAPRSATSTSRRRSCWTTARRRRRTPSATIGRPRVPARGRRMPGCRTDAPRSISSAAASCCCGSATARRTARRSKPRSRAAACRSRSWRSPMPEYAELYERRFVLVRPDGHVAWRGDTMPDDPLAVVDRVRGA